MSKLQHGRVTSVEKDGCSSIQLQKMVEKLIVIILLIFTKTLGPINLSPD